MTKRTETIKQKIRLLRQLLGLLLKILGLQKHLERHKTEEMVRRIAANYKVDVEELVATIWCESRMNPKAINRNKNGTTDYGLCQFNDYWYGSVISPERALNDPEYAVEVMCKMWEKGNRGDWICFKYGGYIKYLKYENKHRL